MIDYIREYIDYHYKSVLVPSLPEILKAYYYNHQDLFEEFENKHLSLDDLLMLIEEYIINNPNIPLNIAVIKVLENDK